MHKCGMEWATEVCTAFLHTQATQATDGCIFHTTQANASNLAKHLIYPATALLNSAVNPFFFFFFFTVVHIILL